MGESSEGSGQGYQRAASDPAQTVSVKAGRTDEEEGPLEGEKERMESEGWMGSGPSSG